MLNLPLDAQPMIRGFRTQIRSSVLASDEGNGRCHQVMALGLDFGGACPRQTIKNRLNQSGHPSAESLRAVFAIPDAPLLAKVVDEDPGRLRVATAPDAAVLYQALMLGLCNAERFDPNRPVIWTEQSLSRSVVLYNPAGFYQ